MGYEITTIGQSEARIKQCQIKKSDDLYIAAEIVLGSPGKQCLGHGICMIMNLGVNPGFSCPSITVLFHQTAHNQIKLLIPKALITEKMHVKHFSSSKFQTDETITIPNFICDALHLIPSSQIPSGKHAVSHLEWFIQITLPIQLPSQS